MDGAAGPLQARLYDATPGHPGEPIILYFHGGGWVTGDLNTYDASDRALATQAHAMVLSVAYRLAPENRFPAAHDDAFASYRWLLANAASLGRTRGGSRSRASRRAATWRSTCRWRRGTPTSSRRCTSC